MSPNEDLVRNLSEKKADPATFTTVDLNAVFARVLKPYQTSGRNQQVIVRCDHLPLFTGDEEVLESVFSELVKMILVQYSKEKRFLHILCQEEKISPGAETAVRYQVQMLTNLVTDSKWKALYGERLIALQAILNGFEARLHVHDLTTSGCLFSISLPGKNI